MKSFPFPRKFFSWGTAIFVVLCIAANAQAQWATLNAPNKPRNVKDISISADGTTIYVADELSLYKSTNSGSTWSKTTGTMDLPILVTSKPDNPSIVISAVSSGYSRSTDAGGSWGMPINSLNTILRLATSSVNSSYMYMGKKRKGGYSSLSYSSNGGTDWNGISDFQNTYTTDITDVAPFPTSNNSGNVWAVGKDSANAAEGSSTTTDATTRGVWFSYNNGSSWSQKKMGSYNLTAVGVRDQGAGVNEYVFVGTASGKLFYSTNAGGAWSERTAYASASSATAVRAIRVRTDSTRMYVVSDKGIHKSTDDGGSWTNISSGFMYANVLALTIVPNAQRTMYATTDRAVYKTTDGGENWSATESGLGVMNTTATVGTGANAWSASRDYSLIAKYDSVGSSWSTVTLGSVGSLFIGENILRHPHGEIFATGSQSSQAVIYSSTDAGSSFSQVSITDAAGTSSGNTFKGVIADPKDSSHVFAYGRGSNAGGTVRNLFKSITSGSGYTAMSQVGAASSTITSMIFDPTAVSGSPSQVFYVAVDGDGIYKTTNEGYSWSQVATSTVGKILAFASNPTVSNIIYAAGDKGLFATTNGGTTWIQKRSDSLRSAIALSGTGSSAMYVTVVTAAGAVEYTYDGGTHWITATGEVTGALNAVAARTTTGLAGIYVSGRNGSFSLIAPASSPGSLSHGTGYINAELSWSQPTRSMSYHLLEEDDNAFNDPIMNNQTLTTNSFRNYNLKDTTLYYFKVAALNAAGKSNFSSVSSFTTSTHGSFTMNNLTSSGHPKPSWTPTDQNGGSPIIYNVYHYACTYGAGDCNYPGTLIAQTSDTYYIDNGVTIAGKWDDRTTTHYYYVTASSVSTKVNYDSADGGMEDKTTVGTALPKVTQLNPSYPNPFNPTTTISYDLNKDGFVSLKVYNILGQEVATLINGEEKAGTRSVQFDGARLGSGVYFCTMQAPGYNKMMKLMLVK